MTTSPVPQSRLAPRASSAPPPPPQAAPRRPWEPKPRVYLAGKITGGGGWREALVPRLGKEPFGCPIDCGKFIFVGPHYVPFQGKPHEWTGWHIGVEQKFDSVCPDGARPRWLVPALCLEWIRRSDLFFCWIDHSSCHATLTEIGWAHMLGLPVYIAFAHCGLEMEMWFIRHGPRTLAREHSSAAEGLAHALAWKAMLG